MEEDEAERSTREIQILLRNLDPRSGNKHRDRVRRIDKFLSYVKGNETNKNTKEITTPEFYDDDLPYLFLGKRPEEEESDDEEIVGIQKHYGLLHGCGAPSTDHPNSLKRSASNVMSLIKYLTIDHVDLVNGRPLNAPPQEEETEKEEGGEDGEEEKEENKEEGVRFEEPETNKDEETELNAFAAAFCSCSLEELQEMNLDLHLMTEESRSADKEDACQVIALLIINHLKKDGETPDAITYDDLLFIEESQQKFQNWLEKAPKRTQQDVRRAERIAQEIKEGTFDPNQMNSNSKHQTVEDFLMAESQKNEEKLLKDDQEALPKSWAETRLYKEDVLDRSERDRTEAQKERARLHEEKARINRRDPLGLRGDNFDLMIVNQNIDVLVSRAIQAFDEKNSLDLEDNKGTFGQMLSLEHRREAFLDMLDQSVTYKKKTVRSTGEDDKVGSILPTDDAFDPALFLSLVHGTANFKTMKTGFEHLSNKKDTQVQRLEDLVKNNFDLFARCADGSIDVFAESGMYGEEEQTAPASERLQKVDELADCCFTQAKRSFKPLLDNTTEVLKTQSALAVLQRSRALLQVPTLMRQHLEAGRVSAAIKAFRRTLVINDDCKIELLKYVKDKANEIAFSMKKDLENNLANRDIPVERLIESVRDLCDLNELNLQQLSDNTEKHDKDKAKKGDEKEDISAVIQENLPAVACLIFQTGHFEKLVQDTMSHTETLCNKIYAGDSSMLKKETKTDDDDERTLSSNDSSLPSTKKSKRWRYDILEARVISTAKAVSVSKEWLPRLLRIGIVAREAEKRDALKSAKRDSDAVGKEDNKPSLFSLLNFSIMKYKMQSKTFEVFVTKISPIVTKLVQHTTFCALGCGNRRKDDKKIIMTFGKDAPESLRALLRSPLPPKESTRVATELVESFEVLKKCYESAENLRPKDNAEASKVTPFEEAKTLAEEAVISVEKRRCIFALDVTARNCYRRASGGGLFDAESLFQTLQKLSEEMCRPDECINEIEKGSQLVVRRICEGLAEFVRDRSDSARLRCIAECANALTGKIVDVTREVSFLTNGHADERVERAIIDDILALESTLWQEFVDSVGKLVISQVNMNWVKDNCYITIVEEKIEDNGEDGEEDIFVTKKERSNKIFPGYLSTSFLTIIKCRAIVERALGEKTIRKSENTTYLQLATRTSCDCVVESICAQINIQLDHIEQHGAFRLLNELQFLLNTIQKNLSKEILAVANKYLGVLKEKADVNEDNVPDGSDGLGAIEELERLGRVYVMCFNK